MPITKSPGAVVMPGLFRVTYTLSEMYRYRFQSLI